MVEGQTYMKASASATLGDCLEAGTAMLVNFAFGARCEGTTINSEPMLDKLLLIP